MNTTPQRLEELWTAAITTDRFLDLHGDFAEHLIGMMNGMKETSDGKVMSCILECIRYDFPDEYPTDDDRRQCSEFLPPKILERLFSSIHAMQSFSAYCKHQYLELLVNCTKEFSERHDSMLTVGG